MSYCGTRAILSYARRRNLIDVPNHRSSHTVPTPRGGGVGVMLGLFVLWALSWLLGLFDWTLALALLPSFVIAIIGWVDDQCGLSARLRLVLQLSLATLTFFLLGRAETSVWSLWFLPLAVLACAWLTNLYNFMDGIDGLSGTQLATVGLMIAVLSTARGDYAGVVVGLGAIGAAVGFLFFNWTPARIFMGDVGSAASGYWLAAWALHTVLRGEFSPSVWLVVHAAFIGDATWTLVVRISHGQRPAEAHRLHLYQKLTQMGWSHARVALSYGCFNLFLLLPLAALHAAGFFGWPWAMGLAYLPVLVACYLIRAGVPENPSALSAR